MANRLTAGAERSAHPNRIVPQPCPRAPLSAEERSLRASIAVNTSWANTQDREARTLPGRRAAEARFERLVDPDGKLPPEELAKRVRNAKKAHYARLAYLSARARRNAKEAAGGADVTTNSSGDDLELREEGADRDDCLTTE